jgi:hypothetical protein
MEKVMQKLDIKKSDGDIDGFYVPALNQAYVSVTDLKNFVKEVLMTNAQGDKTKIMCARDFNEFLDFIESWIITHHQE